MSASVASGGPAVAGAEEQQLDQQDDDEIYQYPKAGLGPAFASIESLLRCAICGGISDPPVSLPCCQQTFCSLCIRQYLDSTTPRCPCCRKASASNQLLLCKELRSICKIWMRNRRGILAAADASSEAAGGAAAVAAAPEAASDVSSGRRRVLAVGAGQGRDGGGGGKMAKLYYHLLNEKTLKQKLTEVGLPVGGGKTAMIARHKRLALLDAASSDREVPVPRRELIRQVASWEREKDKEKLAATKAARSAAGGTLSSPVAPTPASGASAADESVGDSAPPQEKVVIPKEMQAGFSALIANARKNAKKRPSASSSGAEGSSGGGGSKKARVSQESGRNTVGGGGGHSSGGTDAGGVGSTFSNGIASDGGGLSNGYSADGFPVPAAASGGSSAGDGSDMRILGVAGRMVRTHGPWRCVFSRGELPLPLEGENRSNDATAAAAAAAPVVAAAPAAAACAPSHKAPGMPFSVQTYGAEEKPDEALLASKNKSASSIGRPSGSSSSNSSGGDGSTPSRGQVQVQGGQSAVVEADSRSDDGGHDGSGPAGRGGDKKDVLTAEALKGEGLLYLNTVTGESRREPPLELVARAEEAENAGEYLVFVPHCRFIAAAAAAAAATPVADSSACAFGSNEARATVDGARVAAAAAVGAAADNVLQSTIGELRSCAREGADFEGQAAVSPRRGSARRQLLGARTPPTASKPGAASSSSSTPFGSSRNGSGSGSRCAGGETRERLASLDMIDLSQGEVTAAAVDFEKAGIGSECGGGGVGGDGEGIGDGGTDGAGESVERASGSGAAMWACEACTLLNKARRTTCLVCAASRPNGFKPPQRASQAPPSLDSLSGANRRLAGSGSTLRLPRSRTGGSTPQSTITSFASRPASKPADVTGMGKSTGGGSGCVQTTSSSPAAAVTSSTAGDALCRQSPQATSTSLPPINPTAVLADGFPTVRSPDCALPPGSAPAAAPAPEKPQQPA